jgi:hypothetical protein
MEQPNGKANNAMKWLVLIVASAVFFGSAFLSFLRGKEIDTTICWVFIVVAGLVWGANFINILKK